jgi:spore coat polysaccharide biosynthesis predicted glycosyltransferase SpsG
MAPPRALFRPDALAGFGHLSRTLALATAWTRAGGTVDVDASGIDDTWRRRFETIGATFDGAARSDWCVLDGYGNDLAVQRRARVDHDHVLVIDDHGSLGAYDADLVLDHNIGADRGDLLGSRYLLLRTEFADEPPDRPPPGRRVLLAPGGAPSSSTTATFDGIAAGLIAAGAGLVWLRGVDDVVATMASADVAVAAAGVTAYELCRVGVPAVLVAVAENQEPVARRLDDAGAAVSADHADSVDRTVETALGLLDDPDRCATMTRVARRLVDGLGADRVVTAMRSFLLDVRPATPEDLDLTWEWSNDPDVRRQSFESASIPRHRHEEWFARRLADPEGDFLIVESDGVPVGQARIEGTPTTLGYLVGPASRGRGLASPLLVAACRQHFRRHPAGEVIALVKPDNRASVRALDLAGFEPMDPMDGALRFRSRAGTT